MSHPAFATVDPAAITTRRERRRGNRNTSTWQSSLGVSSKVSGWNLAAFLLHSTSSILFLVFLNSVQPFLISQLGETKRQGSLSGTLVFADELMSMFLVLFWGSLADLTGTKPVAVMGYCFIALALFTYTLAQKAWPHLLFCRLLFAVGGSAVTAMLSGILNSYSVSHDAHDEHIEAAMTGEEQFISERTALLDNTRSNHSTPTQKGKKNRHGRLAAATGLMTGVGALIAVFFLLRLPTLLASIHDRHAPPDLPDDGGDEAVRRGTREAFYIVAAVSLVVAILLAFGLQMDKPDSDPTAESITDERPGPTEEGEDANRATISAASARQIRRQRLRDRLQRKRRQPGVIQQLLTHTRTLFIGIFSGFSLAGKDLSLSLGYLSGGLARACTIATTVFIPLLVTRFFYTSGLCSTLPSPDLPPAELKRICRQAFTVASILSGVIQLIALLLSPLVGYLCEALSPAITILMATTLGTASFLAMGLGLPNDGDPRSAVAWVAAVGIGFCQITTIVASLALCAGAKAKSTAAAAAARNASSAVSPVNVAATRATTGGSIAGAYSATGGLFILLISKLGGTLSDLWAPAAFLLLAFMAAITALLSLVVVIKERNNQAAPDSQEEESE